MIWGVYGPRLMGVSVVITARDAKYSMVNAYATLIGGVGHP